MAQQKYIMRPVESDPPKPGDVLRYFVELTFTTTGQTVTHTIETEDVVACIPIPHGTTVAATDGCGWSESAGTLTITRGAGGTSALIVTVEVIGHPKSSGVT